MSLKVRVYQGDTCLNQETSLELEGVLNNRKSIGRITATIVKEVYANARHYKKQRSRLFKGNEPVFMRITMDGNVIDLGNELTVSRDLQQKLKIQLSEAGEKRYAQQVFNNITFAMRKPTLATDLEVKAYELGK
tara:strand:+ start:546 stop:947 length:402 start_codon:yes stop_codon:yes gene_type:complete